MANKSDSLKKIIFSFIMIPDELTQKELSFNLFCPAIGTK